ncbi:MAG: hypothetical protein U1E61_00150 [Bradyrhizobium sp.]
MDLVESCFIMRSKSKVAMLLVLVSAPLLGAVHLFFYSWPISLYLYELAGGIAHSGGWTRYGGAHFAWTIPLQLPGTLLLSWGKVQWTDVIGNFLVLAASIGVGYSVASLVAGLVLKKKAPPPYLDWRVLIIILGMIWVPVPETLAFVYYPTVKY